MMMMLGSARRRGLLMWAQRTGQWATRLHRRASASLAACQRRPERGASARRAFILSCSPLLLSRGTHTLTNEPTSTHPRPHLLQAHVAPLTRENRQTERERGKNSARNAQNHRRRQQPFALSLNANKNHDRSRKPPLPRRRRGAQRRRGLRRGGGVRAAWARHAQQQQPLGRGPRPRRAQQQPRRDALAGG